MATRSDEHVRGRRRVPYVEAVSLARRRVKPGERTIQWGGLELPESAKTENFFYLGSMGSGKTVALFQLIEQVLTGSRRTRAVIYDYKMNIHPFLRRLGIERERIKIMNPFDKRACGWDIQKDITGPEVAGDIAHTFVPENPKAGSGKYFDDASRQIVRAAFLYFFYLALEREEENAKRKDHGWVSLPSIKWELRDVLNLLKDEEAMRHVFAKKHQTQNVIAHFENKDVLSTLQSHVGNFDSIAARWSGKELVSFRDWLYADGGTFLILGHDGEKAQQLRALNRLMVGRMIQLVTTQTRPDKPETWFVLDEFTQLGRINEFTNSIGTIREYKGCLALATQNVDQMREDHLYGERGTSIILQECLNKTFMRCDGANAEYASQYIGSAEKIEEGDSDQIGRGGMSFGTSRQNREKRLVLASEFSSMQRASKENGAEGFYLCSSVSDGVYYHRVLPKHLSPATRETPVIDYDREESPRAGDLLPMTEEERTRFGLVIETPQPEVPKGRGDDKGPGDTSRDREPPEKGGPSGGRGGDGAPPQEEPRRRPKITFKPKPV